MRNSPLPPWSFLTPAGRGSTARASIAAMSFDFCDLSNFRKDLLAAVVRETEYLDSDIDKEISPNQIRL